MLILGGSFPVIRWMMATTNTNNNAATVTLPCFSPDLTLNILAYAVFTRTVVISGSFRMLMDVPWLLNMLKICHRKGHEILGTAVNVAHGTFAVDSRQTSCPLSLLVV